jgi:hypothetical protein
MKIEYRAELKVWLIYFVIIFFSTFIHEIGHCIPAWINGYRAIPTPAKEYMSITVPFELKQYISLGGIIGTVMVSILILILYSLNPYNFNTAVLAGAIATPGFYTLRFMLAGRGHDATEFQEAQSALGLNYSAHSLDWFFLLIFSIGVIVWVFKSKPSYKVIGRILIGFVLTLIFIVCLQSINNTIFDPIFQAK